MSPRRWSALDHLYFRIFGKVSPKVLVDRLRQIEETGSFVADPGRRRR